MERWAEGRCEKGAKAEAGWGHPLFPDQHRRVRDRALFDLVIDSKLRGCEVVRVKMGDLVIGSG